MAYEDPLERRLVQIWTEILGFQSVGHDESFFDLGGDQLTAVRISSRISRVLGLNLPVAVVLEAPTVRRLAEAIRQNVSHPESPLVVPINPVGLQPRFFCVHPVGGNLLCYERLAHHLGPDQPFFGIQSQGLDGQELPLVRVEDMASCYISQMRRIQPSGPYFIGGYSLGGVIAFEMARQLDAEGQRVGLLALMDSHLPSGPLGRAQLHVGRIKRLPPSEVFRYVWSRIIYRSSRGLRRTRNIILHRRNAAIPNPLRSVNDGSVVAHRRYVARPYRGTAVLFHIERPGMEEREQVLRWSRVVNGGLSCQSIPGDHNNFLREPAVAVLAAQLRTAIRNAQEELMSEWSESAVAPGESRAAGTGDPPLVRSD